MSADPRIAELEQWARDEGIRLPMPATLIAFLERQGRVVDLCSGEVYTSVIVTPTRHAQAVSYLLNAGD